MSVNMSSLQSSPFLASATPFQCSPVSSSSSISSPRSDLYKNKEKDLKQLRRRRSETVVELRKQKKESDADRRRNITGYELWSDDELCGEEEEQVDLDAFQILELVKTQDMVTIPAKYVRRLRKVIPKGFELKRAVNEELRNELLSSAVITKLLSSMQTESCPLKLLQEVVALMAQLCSGDKDQTLILVNCHLIDVLLPLLSYDNFSIVEQSVLALAFIWNSCLELSKLVSKTPFLQLLVGLIDSETSVSPSKYSQADGRIGLLRTLSWALYIICQNHELMSYQLSLYLIPHFVKLLNYCDIEVKTNVLKTLSTTTERVVSISEDENSPILRVVKAVTSNGTLFSSVVNNLSSNAEEVVLNAIRTVANIVSWGESYAQIVIQAGVLAHFPLLLTHPNSLVQKEAAFTVSNITAGNSAQIQAVIDENLLPAVIELLYMGDYRTQCEASHVVLNISAVGSREEIFYMLNIDKKICNMDVIDAMASMLTACDSAVLTTCLNFYNNILVFAKRTKVLKDVVARCELSLVISHFETLQNHKNSKVAVLATHIMDEFFSNDISLEEDVSLDTSLVADDNQMEENFIF